MKSFLNNWHLSIKFTVLGFSFTSGFADNSVSLVVVDVSGLASPSVIYLLSDDEVGFPVFSLDIAR